MVLHEVFQIEDSIAVLKKLVLSSNDLGIEMDE